MEAETSSNRRSPGFLLGCLVKEKREAAGISQGELARQLRLTASYVSRLERGKFRQPKPSVLMALADRINIDINDLYAVTGCLLSTELPSFAAYLHAKHPNWPEGAIEELTDYYEFIKQKRLLQ